MPRQPGRLKSSLHRPQAAYVGERVFIETWAYPQILLVLGLVYIKPWICDSDLINELMWREGMVCDVRCGIVIKVKNWKHPTFLKGVIKGPQGAFRQ